jgi:hypothetical protein
MTRRQLLRAVPLAAGAAVLGAGVASLAGWEDGQCAFRLAYGVPAQLLSPDTDYQRQPAHLIASSPPASHFEPGSTEIVPTTVQYQDGQQLRQADLDSLLHSTSTHAFIVTRDETLLYEQYFNGYQRDSVCVSMSMAKSFTSALVGIAIDEGVITSVNDPITAYLPELQGRGFDPITIRHLLTMGSGIRFNTVDDGIAYFYPDLRQLLLTRLSIQEPPGQSFHYNSYNTELLGLILQRTTQRTASQYLQDKIWMPVGMEYPATWSIDSDEDGLELMQSAINARPIDYAKFGRLYLNRGNWGGRQIVSDRWVEQSATRDPLDHRVWENNAEWADGGGYYTNGWWGLAQPDGPETYMAVGKYGQYIFISPPTHVVIVRTAKAWGLDWVVWPRVFQYVADQIGRHRDVVTSI